MLGFLYRYVLTLTLAFATYNGMIYGEPRYSAAHAQPASSTVLMVFILGLVYFVLLIAASLKRCYRQIRSAHEMSWILVAVVLSILCLRGVTAQSVSVESTHQPSCLNEPLILICAPKFDAVILRWEHTAFDIAGFSTLNSVGDTTSTSDGRVVANLTMKALNGALLASTLTLYPPLNTSLNNTMITCKGTDSSVTARNGSAAILLEGEPSPPVNLSSIRNDIPTATIDWDPPLYTGQNVEKYTLSIPCINSVNHLGNVSSHIIKPADGSGVNFNVSYNVEVVAISTCGSKSKPSSISVMINGSAAPPPVPFLNVSLLCSVGYVRADLQWEYGTSSSTVYTPPTDSVIVKINPAPPSSTKCDVISLSDMSCSFNTTTNTLYTVVVYAANYVGTTPSNNVIFDSRPLLVDNSGLIANPPYIFVSVNSLCQNDDTYLINVQLGDRISDASSSKEGSKFSVFGAVGLTFSLTFITAFILGATFVLALCYCLPRRRRSRRDPSAAQEVTEAAVIYDLPTDLVRVNESDPDTRENTAYIVSHGVPTTNNPAYGKVHR